MKKLLCLALALITLFAFFACGGGSPAESSFETIMEQIY